MKTEISHWHRVAELFLEKKLTLPEIGKLMIINEAIGLIDPNPDAQPVGINVIDNSNLNDALVFGLLKSHSSDKPISYPELAKLLDFSARQVGLSVDRLSKAGIVVKEDRGRLGTFYIVHADNYKAMPVWVTKFTEALTELHNDPELKAKTAEKVSNTHFYRGFEVLKQELRDKFYRPRKQPNTTSS